MIIISFQRAKKDREFEIVIKEKEEELEKHPEKTKAAWDLARIKLESYLDRNISQVRWIFVWTVIVMIAGFIIIGYGIFKVYNSSLDFEASILVTVAGVITEIIGATFLVLYKSTMNQAKDYVNVLERINAIGMSVQILDTIDKSSELQNQTKAELSKELLKLYGRINK